MSKYKVITIAIAVKNNRIAKFGETVDDSELTVNASELIDAGSLELIKEKSAKEEKETAKETVVAEKSVEEAPVEEVKKAPTAAEKASK